MFFLTGKKSPAGFLTIRFVVNHVIHTATLLSDILWGERTIKLDFILLVIQKNSRSQ